VTVLSSLVDGSGDAFVVNAAHNRALVAELRAKVAAAALGGGERARERHLARGKLLPRDRVTRLLDPGSPFLEIGQLAAHGMYDDAAPGAGAIGGIGRVQGRECMIVADDATVVRTVGVESDAELSFAGLRDLLAPLRQHLGALQPPVRAALGGALLLGPAGSADRLAVSVGALELCRVAASVRPLVMMIDDYHWVDLASADVLRFVAARVRDHPIVVVATARTAEAVRPLPEAVAFDLATRDHAATGHTQSIGDRLAALVSRQAAPSA
jgi:hypothetical protein